MSLSILINEVHPNQESGSEWVELILIGSESTDINLTNYALFDSVRSIYTFSNEGFDDQFLVVEVTGLNNDQDTVILKDNLGNVIDSFLYTSTQKGLSWSKSPASNEFSLMPPSRGEANPAPTPTPAPSTSPTLTNSPSPTTTTSPKPSLSQTNSQTENKTPETTEGSSEIIQKQTEHYPYYQLDKIQLQTERVHKEDRMSRLVFMGQKTVAPELKNAIIGSLLLIVGATCLLYVKFKKNHR